MLGEDLSGRFDYLFEPLELEESAGDGNDAAPHPFTPPADDGRWSRRIVLTGVVLATLAAAAATAVVLLLPARPEQQNVTPTDATPLSTAESTAISPAMPSLLPTTTEPPVPVLPATVSTTVVRTPTATATVTPQQPPVQEQPTTIASEPPPPTPPPPTTRAPVSVSPESRAPFPNQTPPRNNDGRGGLLGGLL
jgi:hypothetical protein